jgi:hypothetical protein
MDTLTFFLLALGFFLGALVNQLYNSLSKKSSKEDADKAPIPPPSPPAVQLPKGETLLRLWKDDLGQLCLDMDGESVTVADITQAGRRRLILLLNSMRPWVEKKSAPVPPPPPPSAPVSRPVATRISSSPETAEPASAGKKDVDKPLSMVEQIDKILQTKLETHPLKNRGIRIVESPTGGVVVYVGLSRYETVADIPDAAIQAIIRESIAEWEEISTPK